MCVLVSVRTAGTFGAILVPRRILTVFVFMLLSVSTMGHAGGAEDCGLLPGSPEPCTPLIACIPQTGTSVVGRAFGSDAGRFEGVTNTGFRCTGQWQTRTIIDVGEAVFDCDNGLTGAAYFTHLDRKTYTATGRGKMSDGRRVLVWRGANIKQFLINQTGEAQLTCGGLSVPLN